MPGVIATVPKYQFSDATGTPLAGGTLTTYIAGTNTLTNTWQDQALSIANTNPITLDSRGECVLWLNSTVNYKFVLKNAAGVTQWTVDNISGSDNGLRDALAASGGSALVGFLQSGTGASARTVQAKLRDTVSVKDFGAVGDGVTNDTAAIQAAMTATNSLGGGTLYFPVGTYLVASTITATTGVKFAGAGPNVSVIKTTSATADVIKFDAESCGVDGLGFASSITRTGGSFIYVTLNGSNCRINNFRMTGYYIGIYGTNSSTYWISEGLMYGPVANARGIQLTGTVAGGGNDIYINKVTMSAGANVASAAGINLINTGAVNITDCDIIRHGKCLLINPGSSQFVAYVYANNSYFDTATNGVSIEPTGTGFAQGIRMVGCWTSAHTDSGIKIAAGSTLYGLELIGHQCLSNGVDGLTALAGTDVQINGGAFCGNTGSGISFAAGVSFWSAVGVRSGNGLGKAGNQVGIYVAPGASNVYRVVGCDLTGNTTTNFSDGGTGTVKNIRGNIGVTSGATGTIVVGASPFTYTAGALPETIYINQGTVSLVVVNGVGVFQSSNVSVLVQPNSTVVVTYTVTPSMARTIHNI